MPYTFKRYSYSLKKLDQKAEFNGSHFCIGSMTFQHWHIRSINGVQIVSQFNTSGIISMRVKTL